ncbi:MAG: hypothetical protein HYY37_04245 [Candidatus Aenigmarchaeota archaeon]|nr:hypothetical protein [Candidatus Aenigmarchaeota archaeon]
MDTGAGFRKLMAEQKGYGRDHAIVAGYVLGSRIVPVPGGYDQRVHDISRAITENPDTALVRFGVNGIPQDRNKVPFGADRGGMYITTNRADTNPNAVVLRDSPEQNLFRRAFTDAHRWGNIPGDRELAEAVYSLGDENPLRQLLYCPLPERKTE